MWSPGHPSLGPGLPFVGPSIPGNGSSLPRIFSSPFQLATSQPFLLRCALRRVALFLGRLFFRSGLPHRIPVPDLCTTGNPSSHLPSALVPNSRRFMSCQRLEGPLPWVFSLRRVVCCVAFLCPD